MASDLEITDFDAVADDSDRLVVPVTVSNDSDEDREGTVEATVTAGDDEVHQSQSVTVPAHESAETKLTFDVPYSQFNERGDLSLDVA